MEKGKNENKCETWMEKIHALKLWTCNYPQGDKRTSQMVNVWDSHSDHTFVTMMLLRGLPHLS